MFKKTNFISYLIATFFVIGLYVLSRLYSLVSGTEIFFLSVITQILWIIIVYLFYKQQQIKKPIIYASKLIGLSNYTDDLVEIVKNFADEFTRFHRTINAFQSEGHISSIDLGARLRKIAKLVLLEMKANAVEIALFDEVSQQWSQAMVIGAPRCSDSQAMFAEIQESKVKKIISQGGFQIIALPLLMGGSVYGVIRVEIPSSRRPTKNDLELLNLFSSQGALALVDTRYTDELLRMRRASDESTKQKQGFLQT